MPAETAPPHPVVPGAPGVSGVPGVGLPVVPGLHNLPTGSQAPLPDPLLNLDPAALGQSQRGKHKPDVADMVQTYMQVTLLVRFGGFCPMTI